MVMNKSRSSWRGGNRNKNKSQFTKLASEQDRSLSPKRGDLFDLFDIPAVVDHVSEEDRNEINNNDEMKSIGKKLKTGKSPSKEIDPLNSLVPLSKINDLKEIEDENCSVVEDTDSNKSSVETVTTDDIDMEAEAENENTDRKRDNNRRIRRMTRMGRTKNIKHSKSSGISFGEIRGLSVEVCCGIVEESRLTPLRVSIKSDVNSETNKKTTPLIILPSAMDQRKPSNAFCSPRSHDNKACTPSFTLQTNSQSNRDDTTILITPSPKIMGGSNDNIDENEIKFFDFNFVDDDSEKENLRDGDGIRKSPSKNENLGQMIEEENEGLRQRCKALESSLMRSMGFFPDEGTGQEKVVKQENVQKGSGSAEQQMDETDDEGVKQEKLMKQEKTVKDGDKIEQQCQQSNEEKIESLQMKLDEKDQLITELKNVTLSRDRAIRKMARKFLGVYEGGPMEVNSDDIISSPSMKGGEDWKEVAVVKGKNIFSWKGKGMMKVGGKGVMGNGVRSITKEEEEKYEGKIFSIIKDNDDGIINQASYEEKIVVDSSNNDIASESSLVSSYQESKRSNTNEMDDENDESQKGGINSNIAKDDVCENANDTDNVGSSKPSVSPQNLLQQRLCYLEQELKTVNILLEEAIRASSSVSPSGAFNINEKSNCQGPWGTRSRKVGLHSAVLRKKGIGGGVWSNQKSFTSIPSKSIYKGGDTKTKELQEVCKVHQNTVLSQKVELSSLKKKMSKAAELHRIEMKKVLEESRANDMKITALEMQFAELNCNQSRPDNFGEITRIAPNSEDCTSSSDTQMVSIIKIDAGYVTNLEKRVQENSEIMEKLRKELTESKKDSRESKTTLNGLMNKQINSEKELKAIQEIELKERSETMTKLEARENMISFLKETLLSFKDNQKKQMNQRKEKLSYIVNEKNYNDDDYNYERIPSSFPGQKSKYCAFDEQEDSLSLQVLKQKIIEKESVITNLRGNVSMLRSIRPSSSAIVLKRVSIMQEVHESSIRKLSNVVNALRTGFCNRGDNNDNTFILDEQDESTELFDFIDKLNLLQAYMKTSLHLLVINLTNELEGRMIIRDNIIDGDGEDNKHCTNNLSTIPITKLNESSEKVGVMNVDHIINIKNSTLNLLFKTETSFDQKIEKLKIYQERISNSKDSVIESLISSKRQHDIEIESLQSELGIMRACLSKKDDASVEVVKRLKDTLIMKQESIKKDRIIESLKHLVEEYRIKKV